MRSPHVVVMLTLVAGCGVSADGRTGGPDAAFWRDRCAPYNLYPLLVHARLFGGSYADDVARTVARFT